MDGLPIRGMSLAIVVEQLLSGWQHLDEDDDIHLVMGAEVALEVPSMVAIHRVPLGRNQVFGRLRTQTFWLPQLCRRLGADILLGVLPTTAVSPVPCPRAVLAHDLRHEVRPDQFSPAALQLRRIGYGVGFRQADAVICVSERTRNDLLRARPWLTERVVRVALHGADHVLAWGPRPTSGPDDYAIAFGQYGNKNVQLVIDAWSVLKHREMSFPLVIVGLGHDDRRSVLERVRQLGLEDIVTASPWLPAVTFRSVFMSARVVVFPSDFEGFGLPVIEAMRAGIPVVISRDPALLEVAGGHATIVEGSGPEALATAVTTASTLSPEEVDAARRHASTFTWERAARAVRNALGEAIERSNDPAG